MNKYEMGVVIRADLDEEAYRAEFDKVKGFIERFGGTIDKLDEWGKRKLAYPIQKMSEGVYTFITYSAESGTPKEVEARLRLQENVLRFLTIRKDENEVQKAEAVQAEPELAPEPTPEPEPEPAKTSEPAEAVEAEAVEE